MGFLFTLPRNTVAYLYKEAIDMRLGMFRLQVVIADQLSSTMQNGDFWELLISLSLSKLLLISQMLARRTAEFFIRVSG